MIILQTFTEVGGACGRVTRGLTQRTLLARQLSGQGLIPPFGTHKTIWLRGITCTVERPLRTRDCNRGK